MDIDLENDEWKVIHCQLVVLIMFPFPLPLGDFHCQTARCYVVLLQIRHSPRSMRVNLFREYMEINVGEQKCQNHVIKDPWLEKCNLLVMTVGCFVKPLGQSPRAEQAHNLPQVARDAASFRGGVVDFASRRVQRSRKTNWVDITNMCQLPYPINCTLGTSNYDMDVIGFYWFCIITHSIFNITK